MENPIKKKEIKNMEEKKIRELIQTGRDFIKGRMDCYPDYLSDQQLKKPQPPLVKAAMTDNIIDLPMNFEDLDMNNSFIDVVNSRCSHRVYTKENLSLLQLSYLLWATQGVKDIRGKSYATLRTVPCGGARHQFETYMFIQYVDGLKQGLYHYLPMGHKIELLSEENDLEKINSSLCGQAWAVKASVIFYWSMVCYRAEWRYGIYAHRVALIDAGHIGENLYLAATALKLGCCGVGAFEQTVCDQMFDLDGEEEFIVYTSPLGTISERDSQKEKDFYAFVKEQGL